MAATTMSLFSSSRLITAPSGVLLLLLSIIGFVRPVMSLRAEWVSRPASDRITPKRSGHMGFTYRGTPHVFGGYAEADDDGNDGGMPKRYVTNDLWRWNEDRGGWVSVPESACGDAVPRSRLVGAAVSVPSMKKAYLFGGWDPGNQGLGGDILDTVHELDLHSMTWKSLSTDGGGVDDGDGGTAVTMPDGPTSRHVAVTIRRSGASSSGSSSPDADGGEEGGEDVVLIHDHRCDGYVVLFDPTSRRFVRQPTTGPDPTNRGLHAAAVLRGGGAVVVFGGAARDGQMSNEAFVLDTRSWVWSRLHFDPGAPSPSPRAAPCLCAYSDDRVVLYGGAEATPTGLKPLGDVWALHVKEQKWELLLDEGDDGRDSTLRPPPRNAATMAEVHDDANADGKSFLLTGGWAPFRVTWDDCFVLRVRDE